MKKVKVSNCWAGNSNYYFKLEFRTRYGHHTVEILSNPDGGYWDRSFAKRALDLFETVWGFNRRSIRFDVH